MGQILELAQQPENSYIERAKALFNAGDIDKAFEVLDGYMLREPNDPQALTLAASILKKAKKIPLAYNLAKRTTELRPDRSETWNTLGHCAQQLWRLKEALDCYRKALQRAHDKTHRALYLNNIGSVYLDEGQFKEAESYCRQAIELVPTDNESCHNLGLCLLAQHQWVEGWEYYSASIGSESRKNIRYRPKENMEPTWDGSPGKTVVIYGEQGLGDEICAASMISQAIQDCQKVIFDCDHRLAGLFKRSFPQATVYGTRWSKPGSARWKEASTEIDASISEFEIGRFYRKADEDFPREPYLKADPERVAMWKALFASKGKPVIGIAWTGGTWNNGSAHRECQLNEWKPIFEAIDAHWVSLQYKNASSQIEGTPVVQYAYATLTQDYDDTAALVAALDLVISVPTAVVHLAGALGVPTIAMMSGKPCWKFAGGLMWHPGVTLIPNEGNWSRTVADTVKRLRLMEKL